MILADIQSADWSLALGEQGTEVVEDLDDIDQCIRILLGTRPGDVPLEPLFGCNAWQWFDAPIETALPHVVGDVRAALLMWEPRIEIIGITLVPGDDGSHWRIRVNWRPVDGRENRTTEVHHGRAT